MATRKIKPQRKAKESAPKAAEAPGYFVVKGKTISTRGFNLHGGDRIKPGHFSNGQEALDQLIEAGSVIKR